MANIVLVDDHILLRNGLAGLIRDLGHAVLFEADNGKDFIRKLDPALLPDIVLLDINMPEMDGFATAKWLRQQHPDIRILALSMYDNESSIINMLKCGAKGYILKDSEPAQLNTALCELLQKGFYHSDLVTGRLIHAISNMDETDSSKNKIHISDRETEFLKYTCTELTYKEIADKMFLSPRTVDGYRDALFEKLQLKTRVGLAIYAIKNGLVEIR